MKFEINIPDNELKYKIKPDHIILADKFMDYVILEYDVTINTDTKQILESIYNNYLCSRIALDNYKVKDDEMYLKHIEYQKLWAEQLKQLDKI